jgi:hypothetical protein
MNQKVELTRYIAKSLNILCDEKKLIHYLWKNPRIKDKGGLRLTLEGYTKIKEAGLKEYRIRFEDSMFIQNKHLIWLDNFIDCPWFITQKEIIVFGEKMAIQMVLFSGDVVKFTTAKAKIKNLA